MTPQYIRSSFLLKSINYSFANFKVSKNYYFRFYILIFHFNFVCYFQLFFFCFVEIHFFFVPYLIHIQIAIYFLIPDFVIKENATYG